MDEPQRPDELSEDAWQATPLEVRQCIALLVTKLAVIEARLNQNSQNSSKPPSSDPPSTPPRPAKTPRGKPKTKGAQPGHPDQQRDFIDLQQVASAALAPAHTEVQAAIAEADHVHGDETSWREGARRPWLWVAVGTMATSS